MDPNYVPSQMETKTIFGLTLQQKRNDAVIDGKLFSEQKIVSKTRKVIFIRSATIFSSARQFHLVCQLLMYLVLNKNLGEKDSNNHKNIFFFFLLLLDGFTLLLYQIKSVDQRCY